MSDAAFSEAGVECTPLRRACLTLFEPTPRHSAPDEGTCKKCKQPSWRIDLFGAQAQADLVRLRRERSRLKDPLNPTILRHLERNVFVAQARELPSPLVRNAAPRMLWPMWEAGFSEVIMWTLLPLGYLMHLDALPNTTWMLSGALIPRTWEPFRRAVQRVCTFERYDAVEDSAVVGDPLPRCAPAVTCYRTLHICEMQMKVTRTKSYVARRALDAQLGFPPTPLREARIAGRLGTLRVIFALRRSWHGRHVTNAVELARSCARLALPFGWRAICTAQHLGERTLTHTIRTLRSADVLVSMHGGDCINALHMPPGRTLVELVNSGFERAASDWLNHFRLHVSPVLRHRRVILPPPPGCHLPIDPVAAWNRNASLPMAVLHELLNATVRAAERETSGASIGKRWRENRPEVLRASMVDGVSRAWAAAAPPPPAIGARLDGLCDTTPDDPGDCTGGSKGSFRISDQAAGAFEAAMRECTARCRACARCTFVSLSLQHRDCSWYHACEPACGLQQAESGAKYTTVRVA